MILTGGGITVAVYYWGEGGQYGPFDRQEDGWPHAGQVLRYFREKQGLTAKAFGELYGKEVNKDGRPCTERWVFDMELKNKVPTDITRRRIIVRLLNIPPALLGLASLEEHARHSQRDFCQTTPTKTNGSMLQNTEVDLNVYEKHIRLALHLHRTGNAHNLLHDIYADIRHLAAIKEQARGDLLHQAGELLINNLLLASRIVRDQRQYALAHKYANQAVLLARRLEDNELLATAKHTRGVVKLAWGQFEVIQQGRFLVDGEKIQDAIRDFRDILQSAHERPDTLHPQLLGFTLIHQSRAQGAIKQSKHDPAITNAIISVDQAAESIELDNIDDLYIRAMLIGGLSNLHLGGYYLHRANVFNTLGLPGKALLDLNHFDQLAERTYGLDETRNQAWKNIVRAEALMGLKEYQEATDTARKALIACYNIRSVQNVASILDIYGRLITSSYRKSSDVVEMGDMLQEWFEEEYQQAMSSNGEK